MLLERMFFGMVRQLEWCLRNRSGRKKKVRAFRQCGFMFFHWSVKKADNFGASAFACRATLTDSSFYCGRMWKEFVLFVLTCQCFARSVSNVALRFTPSVLLVVGGPQHFFSVCVSLRVLLDAVADTKT